MEQCETIYTHREGGVVVPEHSFSRLPDAAGWRELSKFNLDFNDKRRCEDHMACGEKCDYVCQRDAGHDRRDERMKLYFGWMDNV